LPPVLQVDGYFFLIFSYLFFSALTDLRYRRAYLAVSLPAIALLVLRGLGMLPLLLAAVPASILLLHYVPRLRRGREFIEDILVFSGLLSVALLSSEKLIALLLLLFFLVDELVLRRFGPAIE